MTKALRCFLLLITGDGKNARSFSPETFVLSLSLFLSFALRHCAYTQCIILTFRLSLSRFFFPPLSSSRTYCLFYVHPPVTKTTFILLLHSLLELSTCLQQRILPPHPSPSFTPPHILAAQNTKPRTLTPFSSENVPHSTAKPPHPRIASPRRAAPRPTRVLFHHPQSSVSLPLLSLSNTGKKKKKKKKKNPIRHPSSVSRPTPPPRPVGGTRLTRSARERSERLRRNRARVASPAARPRRAPPP